MPPFTPRFPITPLAAMLLLLATAGLSGCASMPDLASMMGAPVEAPDQNADADATPALPADPDQQALGRLDDLAAGASLGLTNGATAVVEPTYTAASGRLCRWVDMRYANGSDNRRLACRHAGGWRWSAGVLPGQGG